MYGTNLMMALPPSLKTNADNEATPFGRIGMYQSPFSNNTYTNPFGGQLFNNRQFKVPKLSPDITRVPNFSATVAPNGAGLFNNFQAPVIPASNYQAPTRLDPNTMQGLDRALISLFTGARPTQSAPAPAPAAPTISPAMQGIIDRNKGAGILFPEWFGTGV